MFSWWFTVHTTLVLKAISKLSILLGWKKKASYLELWLQTLIKLLLWGLHFLPARMFYKNHQTVKIFWEKNTRKYYIMKTRLFKYIENFASKNWNFSIKNTLTFFLFLLKIYNGYSQHFSYFCSQYITGTHNLCFQAKIRKIMYTPMHPSFTTVNILKIRTPKFLTKWHMQTVQTQIRLLLKEQSDQGLYCLPFHSVF